MNKGLKITLISLGLIGTGVGLYFLLRKPKNIHQKNIKIIRMEPRDAFKKVVHFANWEYEQKRPKSVKVLRLKSKSTITATVKISLSRLSLSSLIFFKLK